MKRIHSIGLAFVAVVAFGAMATTSAFAASKFLAGGNEIASAIIFSVADEILLEDMNILGKPDLLCSGAFDGTIAVGGVTGQITDVLTLSGELLEGVTTKADLVECEAHSTCSNPVDLSVLNLPWAIGIALESGIYVALILNSGAGEAGYTLDCNSIIGLIEDTCTGQTGALLTNETEGVLGEFSETNETVTVPANCTQGGAKQGLLAGTGVIKNLSAGGVLSVSE